MATEQTPTPLTGMANMTRKQLRAHAFTGFETIDAVMTEAEAMLEDDDPDSEDMSPDVYVQTILAIAQVQATCVVAAAILSLGSDDE